MPTIAFTSCMDTDRARDQPVWDAIGRCVNGGPPDALLLLGDQIYMDWNLSGALADVPAPLRRWRDAVANGQPKQAQKVVEKFAQEMHARYAAQWAQPQFQGLLRRMQDRSRIVLAWDDHDFAWNGAMGLPGQGRGPSPVDNASVNDRVVPEPFKQVSLMLRSQFVQALQADLQAYPPAPPVQCLLGSDCAVPSRTLALGAFTLTALDQRWSRTDRDALQAQLLAPADRAWLKAELARADAGLLILAGSTPLRHRSLLGGHDSWWAPPDPAKSFHEGERSYPEYEDLVNGARRPVLYLGGDIHRNAWGGWAELTDAQGRRAPVLQALSSGAAIGRLLTNVFEPSYGLVRLAGSSPRDVQVQVEFHTVTDADQVCHAPSFQVREGQLHGWVDDGECTDTALVSHAGERLCWQLAQRPMSVLAWRAPGNALKDLQGCALLPAQLDEQTLTDDLRGNGQGWPTLLTATAAGPLVRLQRAGAGPDEQFIHSHWDEAFERARAANAKSLVLFVHGFGKGFFSAIGQAAELRVRFPGAETALFTWPSSVGTGVLNAVSFPAIQQAARAAAPALATAIATFCVAAQRHREVPAVLMVRSLGTLALAEAAPMLKDWPTDALKRLVLNAPACPAKQLDWLAHFRCPRLATANRNDHTLDKADWVHNGPLLGNDPDAAKGPLTVLDCTHVPGVLRAHDYVLRAVNERLHALNRALLCSPDPLSAADLQVQGLRVLQGQAG